MSKPTTQSGKSLLIGSLFLAMVILFSSVYYVKASGKFSPGEVSAMHPKNEPLNGYVSHADFEQSCSHCHAPIHCVTDTRCQECHIEIARERTAAQGLHGILPGTDRCQTCHVEHRGRDVVISEFAYENVDHYEMTGFSLDQHKVDYDDTPLTCEKCHGNDRFAWDTQDCLTCHIQAQHDIMAEHVELYGADCIPCHDGVDRMQNFDHNEFYLLEGEHSETDCDQCHIEKVFAGTAQDCIACHQDPELHAGEFGLDCSRCHTAAAWTPAQLTRHVFFVDHGENPIDNCVVCHAMTMTQFDCYGCHDHQADQMDALHLENGLTDYPSLSCIECHPTGQSNEAAELTGISFGPAK